MYPEEFIERIAKDYLDDTLGDKGMSFTRYLEYRNSCDQRVIEEYLYTGEPI